MNRGSADDIGFTIWVGSECQRNRQVPEHTRLTCAPLTVPLSSSRVMFGVDEDGVDDLATLRTVKEAPSAGDRRDDHPPRISAESSVTACIRSPGPCT